MATPEKIVERVITDYCHRTDKVITRVKGYFLSEFTMEAVCGNVIRRLKEGGYLKDGELSEDQS